MADLIPSIYGIPLGLSARKSIYLTVAGSLTRVTFRVRRNNGAAGGIAGKRYQDQYFHVTAANPRSGLQQGQRGVFHDGVATWKALSEAEKDVYRNHANRSRFATGFTFYMSEYMMTHKPEFIVFQNQQQRVVLPG